MPIINISGQIDGKMSLDPAGGAGDGDEDDTDPRVSERPDPDPTKGGMTAERAEALIPKRVE